jgi:hypothetical protein
MSTLFTLSDDELVARLPALVRAERYAMAEVIEHLVEVERRRLYLAHATSSLYRYCIDRLGYAEDAALKRHRVARLALRVPRVLTELRGGRIHLTGLFLLSTYLTGENADAVLSEARGRSRREIEQLIARRFPRPDVAPSVGFIEARADVTCSGAASPEWGRLEPLSPGRVRVEFTARAVLYDKLQQARQLLSHAVPGGDLGELVERALDALLEKETRRRFGAASASQTTRAQARLATNTGRGRTRGLAARWGPVHLRRQSRSALQRAALPDHRAPKTLCPPRSPNPR